MRYASDTSVSVEKSRAEIEAIVMRYGATEFCSGWEVGRAAVGFKMRERSLRFVLPLPDRNDKRFWHTPARKTQRDEASAMKEWEQACRQSWRALALVIKAKLEAVEAKISTFDSEFMANIVLPSGMTIGETLLPKLPDYLSGRKMPALLPGPTA